ncbi:1157_t:CDS:2, partial [Funneliformis caledonium]
CDQNNIHYVSSPSQNTAESIQPKNNTPPGMNRNLTINIENMCTLHGKLPNIRLPSKFLFGNSKTPNTVPAEFSPIPEPRHYGRDQATNPKDDYFSFTT